MTVPSSDCLWSERFERDSCGFGLIAHLKGEASHRLVNVAIEALVRLTHRGAVAADGRTGDGCGVLMTTPFAFLRRVAAEDGLELPERFAAGMVFLNPGAESASRARRELEQTLLAEGVTTLGWRRVPVDQSVCGEQALRSLPAIEQIFVAWPEGDDENSLNRRLYMARRRAELALAENDPVFYIASLSCTTLAWKAMVMPAFLTRF